ncbi:hypothetical protein [Psychromicrobium xiongbiense]|uniref:hypothetical protein n=1 Tax=Psychromicrobium xiongbiense TaxID=3051184 RepID=UPI0025531784|nr:hypothetical protein [Psychromicrobium sp. YIM S02556]
MNMDASWAEGYNTLAGLKAHSAVAVQGTFTKVVGQSNLKSFPITDFEFTVGIVINDPGHLASVGSKLTIRQTGGTVGGAIHQISDDPLFKLSENAVLFLKQPEPGIFFVLGGPSGRFKVSNGTVTPFAPNGAKFNGSLTDFGVAVKNS